MTVTEAGRTHSVCSLQASCADMPRSSIVPLFWRLGHTSALK